MNDKDLARFMDHVDSSWQWKGGKFDTGYGSFWINGKSIGAHRASYEHFIGPIPEGLDVLHSCDDQGCVDPEHLFAGTQLDNVKDMISKGRKWVACGEKNSNSSLTNSQVVEIRNLLSVGMSQKEIGRQFGIHPSTVSLIKSGKTYGSV